MASADKHLIRLNPGLALLFTPPFDRTPRDPGYIKAYPPGLRENGGQYSHAAMWAVLAHARLGNGDRAAALFAMLNPINHALTPAAAGRYKVEPYVIAADVYATAPHAGRGGWTWYTGSAGWMYRAGIEGILGLSRSGDRVTLNPCIAADWPDLSATVKHADTTLEITLTNPARVCRGLAAVTLDGLEIPHDGGPFTLQLTGGHRRLHLVLGAGP